MHFHLRVLRGDVVVGADESGLVAPIGGGTVVGPWGFLVFDGCIIDVAAAEDGGLELLIFALFGVETSTFQW